MRCCCCCCCCFLHSAHWLPTRKKLLYTVANPARGLLNREKRKRKRKYGSGLTRDGGFGFPVPPQKPCRTRLAHAQRFGGAKSLMLYPKLWSFQPLLYDLNIGIIFETESSLKDRWNTLSPSLHRLYRYIFPVNFSDVSYQYCFISLDQPAKVANPARGQLNREN